MSTPKSRIDEVTGVVISNSFMSPASRSKGLDFSDDLVEVYELKDFVHHGESGDADDFTIEKKPVKVDSYHLNKVIQERSKGCSLKEIVAKCEKTGDYSVFAQPGVYADLTKQPSNLSDALQEGVRTASYIDSLSDEQKQEYLRLAKMSKDEFDSYINSLVEARQSKDEAPKQSEGGEK